MYANSDSNVTPLTKDIVGFTSWTGEYKAYVAEHKFQKAKGLKLEFANEDEIKVHIALNYKKKGK